MADGRALDVAGCGRADWLMGSNASGNQSGDSAETWDVVDSGQSDDIENSLTGQGTSDRETVADIAEAEGDGPIPDDEADIEPG